MLSDIEKQALSDLIDSLSEENRKTLLAWLDMEIKREKEKKEQANEILAG